MQKEHTGLWTAKRFNAWATMLLALAACTRFREPGITEPSAEPTATVQPRASTKAAPSVVDDVVVGVASNSIVSSSPVKTDMASSTAPERPSAKEAATATTTNADVTKSPKDAHENPNKELSVGDVPAESELEAAERLREVMNGMVIQQNTNLVLAVLVPALPSNSKEAGKRSLQPQLLTSQVYQWAVPEMHSTHAMIEKFSLCGMSRRDNQSTQWTATYMERELQLGIATVINWPVLSGDSLLRLHTLMEGRESKIMARYKSPQPRADAFTFDESDVARIHACAKTVSDRIASAPFASIRAYDKDRTRDSVREEIILATVVPTKIWRELDDEEAYLSKLEIVPKAGKNIDLFSVEVGPALAMQCVYDRKAAVLYDWHVVASPGRQLRRTNNRFYQDSAPLFGEQNEGHFPDYTADELYAARLAGEGADPDPKYRAELTKECHPAHEGLIYTIRYGTEVVQQIWDIPARD